MKREIEAFLKLKELAEKMNDEIACIVVEGKEDRKALQKIGYKGKILYFNSLRKVKNLGRKIVILSDFDEEGEEIAKIALKELGERNVEMYFRSEFKKILKSIGRNNIQSIINLCKKYERMYQ